MKTIRYQFVRREPAAAAEPEPMPAESAPASWPFKLRYLFSHGWRPGPSRHIPPHILETYRQRARSLRCRTCGNAEGLEFLPLHRPRRAYTRMFAVCPRCNSVREVPR